MAVHKVQAALVHVADDNPFGILQAHTLEGAQSRGACPDEEDSVLGVDFRNLCCPVPSGQHIPHQQCLEVGDPVGDPVKTLVGIGHPYILGLAAVDAAAQGPAPVGVGTVVHPAVLAEETVAAEGLHIHRHPVTGLYGGDS